MPCATPPWIWPSTINGLISRPQSCTTRSEEHTSELQSQSNLVCRLLLEKKKNKIRTIVLLILYISIPYFLTDCTALRHIIHFIVYRLHASRRPRTHPSYLPG